MAVGAPLEIPDGVVVASVGDEAGECVEGPEADGLVFGAGEEALGLCWGAGGVWIRG